jgi:hypothetical protein
VVREERKASEVSKSLVTRLFVGSIVAVVAGLVLGLAAVIVAYNGGAFVMNGPDVTGIHSTPFAVSMVVLALACIVAIIGGAITGLVSWIGALINTAELDDKTWFVLVLVLGLFSMGFIAMIAYVIAGPDGNPREVRRVAQPA